MLLSPDNHTAKEGHTMNVELWIQLIAVVLRIFAAGMAG